MVETDPFAVYAPTPTQAENDSHPKPTSLEHDGSPYENGNGNGSKASPSQAKKKDQTNAPSSR